MTSYLSRFWVYIAIEKSIKKSFTMELTISMQTRHQILSDKQLLEAIQNEEDEAELQTLHWEFYNRFAKYVFKVATQSCINNGYKDAAYLSKEILQETFIRAVPKLQSFRFREGASDVDCKNLLKGWLGRIANHEFERARKKLPEDTVSMDIIEPNRYSHNPLNAIFDEPVEEVTNVYRQKLQEAMNQLSERDRDIILTCAGEGCLDSSQHLSKESMRDLCKAHNTTSENIRQIKKRALDKIKNICSELID